MSRDEFEDTTIGVLDSLLDTDFGPLPVSPTGAFVPATQAFESDPIPDATEENFICLRGPCRYYLEMRPYFSAGNTVGSLDHAHVLIKRTCGKVAGFEIDLVDEVMSDCISWDPWMPEEQAPMLERRERYYQIKKSKEAKETNE